MAADRALLTLAESGVVGGRIYSWDAVWVTLGSSQTPEETLVDLDRVPYAMRPTGGGAVLHGHDITVAIAIPLRRSVRGTYRLVTGPLIQALVNSGVSAVLGEEMSGPKGTPDSFDCFARVSANDIVDSTTHVKVCGCALRRTASAVLLQASIPAKPPAINPAEVICGGVRSHATSLDLDRFIDNLRESLNELESL